MCTVWLGRLQFIHALDLGLFLFVGMGLYFLSTLPGKETAARVGYSRSGSGLRSLRGFYQSLAEDPQRFSFAGLLLFTALVMAIIRVGLALYRG